MQISQIISQVLRTEAGELNRHASFFDSQNLVFDSQNAAFSSVGDDNNSDDSDSSSVKNCEKNSTKSTENDEKMPISDSAIALKTAAGFSKAIKIIQNIKGKLIITGVGKSGHIAAKIAATLASTGTPSFFLHPTEALHGDLGMVGSSDAVLAISFSGESAELLAILPHIKRRKIPIISMAKLGSSLSQIADAAISLDIIKEACPLGAAPTVSTTLTLALGDALAVVLMELRGFKQADFAAFHPGGSLGKRLFLKASDVMRKNLPIAHQNTPLKEAIIMMSEGKLGTLILVDDAGDLTAVLSDGDLRRALSNADFSLESSALKYATKSPKTLENSDILAIDALKIIENHKIQILIITQNKKPAGALHIHDLTSLGL